MNFSEWWAPHFHGFWIMPFFFMILMCVLAAVMMRRACGWRWGPDRHADWMPPGRWRPGQAPHAGYWSETAWQILDRRYAGGEITKEQYEQMKSDLERSPAQSAEGASQERER